MPLVALRTALLSLAALAAVAAPARGAIVEDVLNVPVHLAQGDRSLVVTRVQDDARGRSPFLVLLHGRPADRTTFVRLGRVDYPANARYFAEHGFTVLIPTRIGYGVTGGADLEYTGPCADKHPGRGIAIVRDEVRQLLEWATGNAMVDPRRGLIVGESFGGLSALGAGDLPGVLGVMTIAGGDGGDSLHHPDDPCGPGAVTEVLRAVAQTTRVPTLWLYSANDRFWGPAIPRRWFDAYRTAGGAATFVELPADKNNGHFIFTRNPPAWRPAFERFVATLGLGLPTK